MINAIIIFSFLGIIIFLILSLFSAIKKTKKSKKLLIGAAACFVIMFIAAANVPKTEKPLIATTSVEATSAPIQSINPLPSVSESPAASLNPSPTTKQATQIDNKLIPAKILKVVDGDTMKVSFNDSGKVKEETIRLLLVDTPESVDPEKPVQPFALDASKYAKDILNDKDVKLEVDVSERDKYGRLLCYLYIGDKMFNEMLLENGYARVAYIYPPNVKYVDKFREIQKTAQLKGINIWSVENYAQEDGFHADIVDAKVSPSTTAQPTATPKPTPTPKPEPKVETNSGGSSSNSNVYYKNCTEARAAGAYNIKRGEPGYSSKLDRDNDGIACEK